jgi:hypothetical protein
LSGNEFDVDYQVLDRAIPAHADASSKVRAIRSDVTSATLPSGAFGKLPQAAELERTFAERHSTAMEAFDNLIDAYNNITDGLKLTLEQYRAADEAVESNLRKLERLI